MRRALLIAAVAVMSGPVAHAFDPADGDADGDTIDFEDADPSARVLVYRRDVERAGGTDVAQAGAVIAAELDEGLFPAFRGPFAAGLDQTAWTPAMAEALAVAIEAGQAVGDVDWGLGLMPIWGRLDALDDAPAWAARCRWALIGGPPDPTPCEKLAAAHLVARGALDPAVVRLRSFADEISGRRTTPVSPGPAPLEPVHRALGDRGGARRALAAWDRQIAAGLSPVEAAAVMQRWGHGEYDFDELIPPLAADAGAWPIELAEGVVLWTHLGRLSAQVEAAFGHHPKGHSGPPRADLDAAFVAPAIWHRVDPEPGGPADVPALAARCRDARIRDAAGAPASVVHCLDLADHLETGAGPLDPQVAALREAAALIIERRSGAEAGASIRRPTWAALGGVGRRAYTALLDLARPAADDEPLFLEVEVFELAGFGANWDAEVAVGTSLRIIPDLFEKYSRSDLYGVAPLLRFPSPDGGAWRPSITDGIVVAVIAAQLRGDAAMGLGGLAAWRAALLGPVGPNASLAPRADLPALSARCRARLLRAQLGHAPPEPTPCTALADALAWGLGGLNVDAATARRRALQMARTPAERRVLRAEADRPWARPEHPDTARARTRWLALGDPEANLYREEFVDFFDVDTAELIDAWERDLAAGLSAEHAAEAVAGRARQWVSAISQAITPPFPADAGAWPPMMSEALTTLVEIGRRTGRAELVFPLLPALDRIHDAADPEADVPALSAACRAAQIEAMDGRPPADIDPCWRLYALYGAGLGPVHPRLTAARLRLAALSTARGSRVEADGWWVEALALWSDPPTVDSSAEAVWALSEALWARGASLRALARPRDAMRVFEAGRTLAAAAGYARAMDGVRFLADEAEAAAETGDMALTAARLMAILEETEAVKTRMAEDDDDRPEGYEQSRALGVALTEAMLTMSTAFAGLQDERADRAALESLANAWQTVQGYELSEYPLAVEVLARLALRRVRADAGAHEEGRREAREALTLQARLDSREQPWLPLLAAAESARAAGALDVAIAWGKEAVDATQAARVDIGALGAAAEERFVEARIDVYSALADWLIEAGRLVEADEVQGLSRRLELSFLTRSSAPEAIGALSRSAPELAWRQRYGGAVRRLQAGRIDAVAFSRAVRDAERRLDETTASATAGAGPADVLPGRLKRLGRVALLQIVLTPDRTRLVLSTPDERISLSRDVGRAAMNARAYAFYRAVRDGAPMATVDGHARALYADLFAPVADRLDAAGITTLMVAPDGALRYVPFAALRAPDGRFAVEERAIVRYPVLSPGLLDGPSRRPPCITAAPDAEATRDDCIAAFGARAPGGGLSVLNFVPAELEGIVRRGLTDLDGRIAGAVHLDADFTVESLRAALVRGAPVVHIASHFVFHPGSARQSFLALGAGARLDLQRLAGPEFPFDGVELLTLSACETAVGTFAAGQPPDSLSALALRKGARAVLASLWPVADDSTATLMRAFYGELAAGRSKAEALRRAQLGLIAGPAPTGRDRKFGLPGARVESGAHPYAWAPFILVGDWR